MIGDILQPTHLIFILVVALLVLGPKRLPEVGRSLGRGIRDFRNALNMDDEEPAITQVTPETPAEAPISHAAVTEPPQNAAVAGTSGPAAPAGSSQPTASAGPAQPTATTPAAVTANPAEPA